MLLQKTTRQFETKFDTYLSYYRFFFALNNVHLTQREMQLVSFIAINGNLYKKPNLFTFCEQFNSSEHTVYNMVGKLIKLNILKKEGRLSLTVHPQIIPDFPLTFAINFKEWTEEQTEKETTEAKETIS